MSDSSMSAHWRCTRCCSGSGNVASAVTKEIVVFADDMGSHHIDIITNGQNEAPSGPALAVRDALRCCGKGARHLTRLHVLGPEDGE